MVSLRKRYASKVEAINRSVDSNLGAQALLLGCPAELVKIQQSVFGILFLGKGSSLQFSYGYQGLTNA